MVALYIPSHSYSHTLKLFYSLTNHYRVCNCDYPLLIIPCQTIKCTWALV